MDALPVDSYYLFAGKPAFATIVFNNTPPPGLTDTITINGVVYTYSISWDTGVGSNQQYVSGVSARRFAERVNGMSSDARYTLSAIPDSNVYARVLGTTVLLYSRVPGTGGNALTLATSNAAAFTISGATFSGGLNASVGAGASPIQSVTHNEVVLGASSTQVIPAGAKGWTVSILTGTASIGSAAGLPAPLSDSDPNVLINSLTITTAAASSAYVRWNS